MLPVESYQQLVRWRWTGESFVHVLWLLVLLPVKLSSAAITRGQVLGVYVLQQLACIAACTQQHAVNSAKCTCKAWAASKCFSRY